MNAHFPQSELGRSEAYNLGEELLFITYLIIIDGSLSTPLGARSYYRGQNLWNNVKKSSKIGQVKKTLKSVFA